MTRTGRLGVAALAMIMLATLGACGDGDSESSSTSRATTDPTDAPTADETSESPTTEPPEEAADESDETIPEGDGERNEEEMCERLPAAAYALAPEGFSAPPPTVDELPPGAFRHIPGYCEFLASEADPTNANLQVSFAQDESDVSTLTPQCGPAQGTAGTATIVAYCPYIPDEGYTVYDLMFVDLDGTQWAIQANSLEYGVPITQEAFTEAVTILTTG